MSAATITAGEAAAAGSPTLSIADRVATIRLNRPAVHNRIEPPDLAAIMALCERIDADRTVRVAVIRSTGRSFSSGFHIGAIAQDRQADENGFGRMVDRVEALRVPVIAALHGGIYGGSTDLCLACDFRIGVPGIRMLMPAAKLGLHYYPSGMLRYVSRLGLGNAKRLFLSGEPFEADEMLRMGFLTELVAADALDARVDTLARTIAANAPLAVQGMKRHLNAIGRGEIDLAAIAATAAECQRSRDLAEGRAAWLEKRSPEFTGA